MIRGEFTWKALETELHARSGAWLRESHLGTWNVSKINTVVLWKRSDYKLPVPYVIKAVS